MLTHEMLGQIEILREQGVMFKKISESFNITPSEALYNYKFYILPFAEIFDSIVKELKLYELAFYKNDCRELFYRVLSRVKKCTKFRNVQLLIPGVVYTIFRANGVTIKARDFCRVSNISLADFKEGLFIVSPVYLDYVKSDHEKLVYQFIAKMIAKFSLDSNFKDVTREIFRRFFPLFKNTKDNIAAGLIIALSFVALDYKLRTLSEIFKALGTGITRAHYHIKHRIFLPNQLGVFNGFVESRERLKQFLLAKI